MQVQRVQNKYTYQPNFEAFKYKIRPFRPLEFKVEVDDNPNLGKIPCLINKYLGKTEVFKKRRTDNNVIEPFINSNMVAQYPLDFYIRYEDSKKELRPESGKNYYVDAPNLVRKAAVVARSQHRQPSVQSLKDGTAVGKVVYADYAVTDPLNEIKEPSILVCSHHDSYLENPNIVGLILTHDGNEIASHHPLNLINGFKTCSLVLKPDIVKKLKELNGKNIELTSKGNTIEFHETDKVGKPMNTNSLKVPKLEICDRILTSKECTSDIVGNKAVNLRKMEELREQGKIDVNIPNFIVLPTGFLKPFRDIERPIPDLRRELLENGTYEHIVNTMKENRVDADKLMIRSAYNCEDLPYYRAEGVFESYRGDIRPLPLIQRIWQVTNSYRNKDPKYFAKINNIREENIQPGVIIQNRVEPDYKLRIYTDDKNGNVRINVFSGELSNHSDVFHPHIFRYNKKDDVLTYDSIQMTHSIVTYDENEKLIDVTPIEDDLSDNKNLFEQLKRVVKNALNIENEFGTPQDIEGGIKGDDIYFWQTKNIVD